LEGKAIDVNGVGTAFRSYMYASDLAEWLWTILLKGKTGQVYNVGSDEVISIKDLAYLVSDCFPHKPEVQINQKPNLTQPPLRYVPSIDRSKKELNLSVRIDLKTAIMRTIDWHN